MPLPAAMPELKERIAVGLDECRTLVLGCQVLLGFEFQAALQKSFHELPRATQLLHLGGLVLLLAALALLLGPTTRHRLVERGHVSRGLERYLEALAAVSLVPFALAFGIALTIATTKLLGTPAGIAAGAVTAAASLLMWYRPDARRKPPPAEEGQREGEGDAVTPVALEERIEKVLTEARVVLPGAQALLGFQFVGILAPGFDQLPRTSQMVHLASLALMAVATILLMAPAAYHRVVERGNASEAFHRYGGRVLLVAMVPLLLGLCGDWYVVARHVTGSARFALESSLALLGVVTALWFGYPLVLRWRRKVEGSANVSRRARTRGTIGG